MEAFSVRLSTIVILFVVAWCRGPMALSRAETPPERAIGVRIGISGPDKGERFHQEELFVLHALPWQWQWPPGWLLSTQLDMAVGALHGAGKTAVIGSFSPGAVLTRPGSRLSILANVGMVFVSQDDFGDQAIGSSLQFGLYAGASYHVGRGVRLIYRYRHLSNAGLFRPNPGLEMHFLGLSYPF
jgi:hypothetical protein